MAVTLEQLIGWIEIKGADKAERDVQKVRNEVSNLGNILQSVGTIGGITYLFSQLGQAARSLGNVAGIGIAAQFERLEIGFTALLGSGSKARDLLKDIKDIASTTPFDNLEVGKFAQDMLAAGFSANGLADDLRAITSAAGALGKTTFDVGRTTGALGRIRRDINQVDADELNEFSNAIGLPIGRVVSSATGKRMDEGQAAQFLQSLKPADAARVLIDGLKKEFAGQGSRGILATFGNLMDDINNIMTPTGKLLIAVLEPGVRLLKEVASVFKTVNEASGGFVGLAAILGGGLIAATLGANLALSALTGTIGRLALVAGVATVGPGAGAFLGAASGVLGTIASVLPRLLMGGIAGALIAGVGYMLYNKFFGKADAKGSGNDPHLQEQKKTNQILQELSLQVQGGGSRTASAASRFAAEYQIAKWLAS